MCSPVEGPRRTETSHFLIKSLELKCHVHVFSLFIYIYIYAYIYAHIHLHANIYISIYSSKDMLDLEYIANRSVLGILLYYFKIIGVSMFVICLADEI